MESLTPFQIPAWTQLPSDDETVRAIVGPAGSDAQRADAEAITRDLLLPRLRSTRDDLSKLRWQLEGFERSYRGMFRVEALGDELLRFAVFEYMTELGGSASRLAHARLKHALWPAEPTEEDEGIDPATVPGAAMALHYRMLEIEGRYRKRLPVVFSDDEVPLTSSEYGEHRTIELVRNMIHVALTGDHGVTSGGIFDALVRHGIETRRHPMDKPF